MRIFKHLIYLFFFVFILYSCTDIKSGTIYKCKQCRKIIRDDTYAISVAYWNRDYYKPNINSKSYCSQCGHEIVTYIVKYICNLCNSNYKVDTYKSFRNIEQKDKFVHGKCEICSKVTITDLVSLYKAFTGDGYTDFGHIPSANAKQKWLSEYQNRYAIGEGVVLDIINVHGSDSVIWKKNNDINYNSNIGIVSMRKITVPGPVEKVVKLELSEFHTVVLFWLPEEKYKLDRIYIGDSLKFVGSLKSLNYYDDGFARIIRTHEIDNCEIIKIY